MAKKLAEKSKTNQARSCDYELLRSPIVTEKTSLVGGAGNTVVLKVPPASTKGEIAAAVRRVFGVEIKSVRTLNVLGKVKRTMRSSGRRKSYKKAFVTLKEGQKIDLIQGV